MQNANRFVVEDKADLVIGSAATPVAVAMADPLAEAQTMQIMVSPGPLPPGKDAWPSASPSQRHHGAPHGRAHEGQGIKTLGFLGYTDAYGEAGSGPDRRAGEERGGIKIIATERFARADTAVTAQALKLVVANPMPSSSWLPAPAPPCRTGAMVERGYKGKIYQTHAAASRDLMRIGGKDVEGTLRRLRPGRGGRAAAGFAPSKAWPWTTCRSTKRSTARLCATSLRPRL